MRFSVQIQHLTPLAVIGSALFLNSCTTTAPTPNPKQEKPLKAVHVNPYKSGSYAHFTSAKSYPKTYKIYKNKALLTSTNENNSKVVVDLGLQRAFLINNDQIAMDYPVSTGNKKFPTSPGSFQVLKKIEKEKRSNLYGKIYDADGEVVNSNANFKTDPIPEGGKFEGALMAHWMRLTWDGVGMHRGNVPRYPASHGCIRTPGSVVEIVFHKVKEGTPVTIRP